MAIRRLARLALVALLGFGQANAAVADRARQKPPLAIRSGTCQYSAEIQTLLSHLTGPRVRYADEHHIDTMLPHAESAPGRFAFADLHGVGVQQISDAELTGTRLYFTEDASVAISTLKRLGFHVGAAGEILEARKFNDEDGLFVAVKGVPGKRDDRIFPSARSYLFCESV